MLLPACNTSGGHERPMNAWSDASLHVFHCLCFILPAHMASTASIFTESLEESYTGNVCQSWRPVPAVPGHQVAVGKGTELVQASLYMTFVTR